ncbi:MAG: sensor domain-containing diguanylate cyclase, partial [Acidobacteria bacterium]|nr:sensor domain-containing diguanylate cyclase [Acidobacteriota bacterium]
STRWCWPRDFLSRGMMAVKYQLEKLIQEPVAGAFWYGSQTRFQVTFVARNTEMRSSSASPAVRGIGTPRQHFHSIDADQLDGFLKRLRVQPYFSLELNLAENLIEVLRRANEFVPSAAGSILLDDPRTKSRDRKQGRLTFIAAFGEKAKGLVGTSIPASQGIAGHVYLSGSTYCTPDVRSDRFFYSRIDEKTEYTTESLIAIPIRIEKEVCGVLELINRKGAPGYDETDRNLLEIFAGYISISIQNVLDGRQAQEIAKRDNLTGLFNDRFLHIALSREIEESMQLRQDLAVLFLDLDYFKRVNDTHGHLAGSQVLREFGHLLRSKTGVRRSIAARYGGDEFVLVLPATELSEAVDLAEEIRTNLPQTVFCAEPGEIQTEPLNLSGLTCSIGIATLKRHLTEPGTPDQTKSVLLRLADAAMYVAKETGRNRTAVAGEPIPRRH